MTIAALREKQRVAVETMMLYGSFALYGLIAGITAIVLFVTIRRAREPWRRRLTWMPAMVPDENGRFLHLFGAERISPEDGDSFDIFHHRLFDMRDFRVLQGASQKGDDLELDSPFVTRSLAGFQESLGVLLRPIRDYEYKDVGDDHEAPPARPGEAATNEIPPIPKGPVVEVRSSDESDTKKPKGLPAFGVIFFENEETRRFRAEVYRDGRRLAVHSMLGDPDYFCHKFYDASTDRLFFTYNKKNYAGMAIAVLDMKTGALLCDKFCDPDKPGPAEKSAKGSALAAQP